MPGFFQHLYEAIQINRQRRPLYEALAGRPARRAANRLIRTEYYCLPIALGFDHRGRRFNAAGIPVIQGDFVSMESIRDASDPPAYTHRAGRGESDALRAELNDYRRRLTASARSHAFGELAHDTARQLASVIERERRCQAHFAMVRHLLESIGLAALNAVRCAELSAGETHNLSRHLLLFESMGLAIALDMDRQAQDLHARGAGFIVNDVPPKPFPPDEWIANSE